MCTPLPPVRTPLSPRRDESVCRVAAACVACDRPFDTPTDADAAITQMKGGSKEAPVERRPPRLKKELARTKAELKTARAPRPAARTKAKVSDGPSAAKKTAPAAAAAPARRPTPQR